LQNREPELELFAIAPRRQRCEHLEALRRVAERFCIRPAIERALRGRRPIARRGEGVARFGVVVRDDFRLDANALRVAAAQSLRDSRVEVLALAAEQARVSRILEERVLEDERGAGAFRVGKHH
jgi:hypothetical protein